MRFPLLLLDLDGTLVDSFGDIARSVAPALGAAGLVLAASAIDALVHTGSPLEEIWVAATGGPPDEDATSRAGYARFTAAYREHYLLRCTDTTVAYPGVRATLLALRARAVRPILAVATAKRTETAERVLAGTGLRDVIDVVAGSEGLPSKPDPAVLRRAAGLADVPVSQALMVGDTARDLAAARAAGCAAALVTYGGLAASGAAALPAADWLLASFAELPALLGEGDGEGDDGDAGGGAGTAGDPA